MQPILALVAAMSIGRAMLPIHCNFSFHAGFSTNQGFTSHFHVIPLVGQCVFPASPDALATLSDGSEAPWRTAAIVTKDGKHRIKVKLLDLSTGNWEAGSVAVKSFIRSDAAIQLVDKHFSKPEDEARAWELRAYAHLMQKDLQSAKSDLDRAISIEDSCNRRILRAKCHIDAIEYAPAAEDLDFALQLNSENAFGYAMRSSLRMKQDAYLEAISDAERALAINARCGLACYTLMEYYQNTSQWEKAFDYAGRMFTIDPENVYAHQLRAYCAYMLENWQSVIDEYSWLIEHDGAKSEYYVYRACANDRLGNHECVIADADAAIALGGKSFDARKAKIRALIFLKRLTEADSLLHRLSQELPNDEWCLATQAGLAVVRQVERIDGSSTSTRQEDSAGVNTNTPPFRTHANEPSQTMPAAEQDNEGVAKTHLDPTEWEKAAEDRLARMTLDYDGDEPTTETKPDR